MQTITFRRTTFVDTLAQRVRTTVLVVAAAAVTAIQSLAGVPDSAPIDTVGVTFVMHDTTLKPVAVRCPSVGC